MAWLFASIACFVTFSISVAGLAQFPIPNPAGVAQDAAVRAALSSFGKSIGDQLPIVVSPSDAYPTAPLPGPPFSAANAPNITAQLRSSSDGTVSLPPGDYAFTVDVFCMKAHAHSPSAHRYLVAPLRGGAADIFRALNSRIPSYGLNHAAVQVLSWDIQAGLPYSAMPAPQRAIVDQVIPDFRSRLNADVYTNIRAQYDQVAAKVPGMPSFDGALGRLGPTGQAILEMQQLREEMAQPPPTFDELVRELIPFAPPEHNAAGDTPWSRYSDRVYVRFVTAGNFATPGTYEVRVLSGAQVSATRLIGLGAPSGSAPVPFSNVVNNPGTGSVQPLTQAPQPGNPLQPTPSPSPSATITSETEATQPADRSRLEVGVNEPVTLTFSGADAHWTISGGLGKLSATSGKVVTYIASITPATEKITAVDTATHATATIDFKVVAPQSPLFEVIPATEATPTPDPSFYHHVQGIPSVGFDAKVYFGPDTVSFHYIKVRERDRQFSATGYYSFENGVWHIGDNHQELNPPWVGINTSVLSGKGSLLEITDSVWSGAKQYQPVVPGHVSVVIPWEYTSASNTSLGPYHIADVTQVCELHSDRSTLTAKKGTASISTTISSPTYK